MRAADIVGMTPAELNTVPDYNFACPTEADVKARLAWALEAVPAVYLWAQARRAVGITTPQPLGLGSLCRAVEHLETEPGLTAIVAASLGVRLRAYTSLTQHRVPLGTEQSASEKGARA